MDHIFDCEDCGELDEYVGCLITYWKFIEVQAVGIIAEFQG